MGTKQQEYRNHRKIDGWQFFFLAPLGVLTLGGALFALGYFQTNVSGVLFWVLLLLISLSIQTMFIGSNVRIKALIAQDRAIRAEEQLRHYVLTGKRLDEQLTMRQIIALRFASDAEFPKLAAEAAKKQMKPDDIKKAIKQWRADDYRV